MTKSRRIPNARPRGKWSKRPSSPIRDLAYGLMRQRADNQKVLAAIRRKFPRARTKMVSVVWYRGRLRKVDKNVPGQREATSPAARTAINARRLAKWRASEYAQARQLKSKAVRA